MNHCVLDAAVAARDGDAGHEAAREKVTEAVAAITRLVKS